MRPAPQRLEDLRRQLADAQGELDKARGRAADGSAETAGALGQAEERARSLSGRMVAAAATERDLEAQIADFEEWVGLLRSSLTATRETRENLATNAGAVGDGVVALRARLDVERSRFAPLVAAREREVARLERRIATVSAYHPDRRMPALFIGGNSERSLAATAPDQEQRSPSTTALEGSGAESGHPSSNGLGAPSSTGDSTQPALGGAP